MTNTEHYITLSNYNVYIIYKHWNWPIVIYGILCKTTIFFFLLISATAALLLKPLMQITHFSLRLFVKMLFSLGKKSTTSTLSHHIKCVCTYAATGSLNFPSCCMRYMRSPPFTYSITKYSRSCKTRHISVHIHWWTTSSSSLHFRTQKSFPHKNIPSALS